MLNVISTELKLLGKCHNIDKMYDAYFSLNVYYQKKNHWQHFVKKF